MIRFRQVGWLGILSLPLAIAIDSANRPVLAQDAVAVPAGQPVTPEQLKAMRRGQGGPPGAPPTAQPGQEAKPEDKDKKKEGEDKKKEEPDTSVKRPEKPPKPPDPNEFKIAVDDKGRIPPFNFIGQPWPDVMQWLATNSKCSLDWQALPNDYLNLTTTRSYTLDEVRDIINRHLTARGFTSIQTGQELRVFEIDKLDPSQVYQVKDEAELYNLKPYDVVKFSFELPLGMDITKAKDDVKQVLNPKAKIFPLVTTRRLLIIDTVANLQTVSEILNQERLVQEGTIVPRRFFLKHTRAEHVIDILYVTLGLDPQSRPSQMDLQLQQQKMQLLMQMSGQGKDVLPMIKKDGPPVYLSYNRQDNSILANAPPEQMRIIEQTVKFLDVPLGGETGQSATVADNGRFMKKYPLTTLDPDDFIETLKEIGGLSPAADFKADSESKILFAMASEADHKKIESLIQDFDGSGRQFHVIQLRRLPADAVAATIYNLMAGQNEKSEDDNRRRYYYDWDYSDRDKDKKKPVKGFGVDADVENNRLMLWADAAEFKRVNELLVQLGEIPSGQRDERQVRFIQPADSKETAALLEQLREAWKATGGNELNIKLPEAKPAPPTDAEQQPKEDTPQPAKPKTDRAAAVIAPTSFATKFVQLKTRAAAESSEHSTTPSPAAPLTASQPTATDQAPPKPAPITITVTEDGRLMLSSADTAALDRLEEIIEQLSSTERRFKVIRLKYIPASHMYWDLKDYFQQDLEADTETTYDYWYYPPRPKSTKNKGATGLAARRKLMITYDVPSNAILVANASASQMAEIEQLIAEFDRPTRSDSVEKRETQAMKITYSKPSVIAATIKEVYRDLLSSKDKEFDRGRDQKDQRGDAERMTVINYGGMQGGEGDSDARPTPLKVGFNGALSLGPDDVSGILVVCAQQVLMPDIMRMVKELDEQAAPKTTVRVHHVNGNVSAESLQKAIDKAVGTAWLGGRPELAPSQGESEQKDGDNRDRNGGNRNNDQPRNGNSND